MEDLSGKVAVITGGASGIGLAMARRFATDGVRLVLGDIEDKANEAAAARLRDDGAQAHAVHVDVTDPASVDALYEAALSSEGAVHIICNNAGVATGGPAWEIPLEAWEWVLDVNLRGVIHGIHSFVPHLIEQGEGHVVNTASAAGLVNAPGIAPYNASKHAVVAISETLAQDLVFAGANVGVSVLCPAFVRTRIHEADRNAPDNVSHGPSEGAKLSWDVFSAMVEAGIDPGIVADQVAEAVKNNRFYVLTHPESLEWIRARVETMLSGGSPTLAV